MSLSCDGVSVRAGNRILLEQLSVAFEAGRFVAILGPNGAGKSTLLSILAGQVQPASGQVLLDGRPVRSFSTRALALRRAVMPQEGVIAFDFTVREVAELGRYPHRSRPDADEPGVVSSALEETDVTALSDRIFNTLSGGEKARVQLSRASAQVWNGRREEVTRWLLLDEPTAALDLAHQHQALGNIRRKAHSQGLGVVAVLHDINLALNYVDDALLLTGNGETLLGPVHDVLVPENIRYIWGVDCTPVSNSAGVTQYLFERVSR